MSKRYWIIAALLGLTVFCAALWYSWDRFSTYQQNQADERAAAAEYQADTAQHSPYSCRSIMDERGIFDWLACLANNVSTDGGVKQAEYDLKAQQDMSAWALGMLIATVWLTVITLLGVFFVWRTLKATQDMARETTRIGEAQSRAYPSATSVHIDGITNGLPSFVVSIQNTGNSPALRINCKGRVALSWQAECRGVDIVEQRFINFEATSLHQITVAPNSAQDAKIYIPHSENVEHNDFIAEMQSEIIRRNPYWMVSFFFSWTDVFGRERVFYINAEQRPAGRQYVSCMAVLGAPFEISYQSESTEKETG